MTSPQDDKLHETTLVVREKNINADDNLNNVSVLLRPATIKRRRVAGVVQNAADVNISCVN